ncbi:hypothetical protein F2Q69_00051060 [Brassica cretica]|uniref:Uncharacterized protein n=1 Tax=Brassica cretica TaxID=69181 RepID=A0A8S9PNL3_BRACR|nr:hypothetical protein F2Q69_00051060 [Brassica cretica]
MTNHHLSQILYCFFNLLTTLNRHLFTFPFPPHPRHITVDRISHKRRYLECKAFFTETPSKHEAIHVSDVTQSAALISHGSVDVKCHHQLTYVADQRGRCSYTRKSDKRCTDSVWSIHKTVCDHPGVIKLQETDKIGFLERGSSPVPGRDLCIQVSETDKIGFLERGSSPVPGRDLCIQVSDTKSPRPLIAVKPLFLRWRISHKRRYLECKAFFTETPSKHEAIHVSDVTQSAALISHGSVDVKCHHQLTYVADQRGRCSYTRRRTRRRLETQPRDLSIWGIQVYPEGKVLRRMNEEVTCFKPTKLDFWKEVRGDTDKMQMLMCVKLKAEVCACARARKGFVHTSIGFVLLQNV